MKIYEDNLSILQGEVVIQACKDYRNVLCDLVNSEFIQSTYVIFSNGVPFDPDTFKAERFLNYLQYTRKYMTEGRWLNYRKVVKGRRRYLEELPDEEKRWMPDNRHALQWEKAARLVTNYLELRWFFLADDSMWLPEKLKGDFIESSIRRMCKQNNYDKQASTISVPLHVESNQEKKHDIISNQ